MVPYMSNTKLKKKKNHKTKQFKIKHNYYFRITKQTIQVVEQLSKKTESTEHARKHYITLIETNSILVKR